MMGQAFLRSREMDEGAVRRGGVELWVLAAALRGRRGGGGQAVARRGCAAHGHRGDAATLPVSAVGDAAGEVWVPVGRVALNSKDSYFAPLVRVNPGVPISAVETQLARVHAQFLQFDKTGKNTIRLAETCAISGGCAVALLALGAADCAGVADCVQ